MNANERIAVAVVLVVFALLVFGPMGLIVILPVLLAPSEGKDAVRFYRFLRKHPVKGYIALGSWVALMAWLFG